jgi:hypothetical protein
MKRKYITTQVLMACLSHRQPRPKDLHLELKETIAERKRLLLQWRKILLSWLSTEPQDIHGQLRKTIAERKRLLDELSRVLWATPAETVRMDDRKAA